MKTFNRYRFVVFPVLTTLIITFTTCMNDYLEPDDGNTYEYVTIGTQTWMAENLNFPTDNSWWYQKSSDYGDFYGRLYTWEAAMDACPAGWHLPSDEEWKTLEKHLGMSTSDANDPRWRTSGDVGKKLKSTSGWYRNGNGDDSSGFKALPGGYRNSDGGFNALNNHAGFWSSSPIGSHAWARYLNYDYDGVYRQFTSRSYGLSVRCLKD